MIKALAQGPSPDMDSHCDSADAPEVELLDVPAAALPSAWTLPADHSSLPPSHILETSSSRAITFHCFNSAL